MRTIGKTVAVLGSIIGLGWVQPLALQAGEHGGQEHGGTSAAPAAGGQEHGGATAEADEAAVLREAAGALRKGEARPDLAAKLEQMADEEAGG